MYTAALRRLAGVTQVVGSVEGHVFHNRLTHTLKVAQIARRIAERFSRRPAEVVLGGIDPEVVEAAALAHDLGHPPFGHIAEHELDRLVKLFGDEEGYEGNAQSFRIVARLAAHHPKYPGLDLTRATLNAILKYPWPRNLRSADKKNDKHYKKFGYYTTEAEYFRFARDPRTGEEQSVEAAIMDIADSLTYSVHDLDDFFRAGLVPLALLRFSDLEYDAFIDSWKAELKEAADIDDVERYRRDFRIQLQRWPTDQAHSGTREQRRNLRWYTSQLIDRYVRSIRLQDPSIGPEPVVVPRKEEMEMRFLQQLVRKYVINNPRLASQQAGQRRIIQSLYSTYYRAIDRGEFGLVLPAFASDARAAAAAADPRERKRQMARVAADIIASLSDSQAHVLFRRICGTTPGSISDILDG